MTNHEILLKNCQEIGLKVYGKTCKHTFKRKLMDLKRVVDELARNGSK